MFYDLVHDAGPWCCEGTKPTLVYHGIYLFTSLSVYLSVYLSLFRLDVSLCS